MLPDPPDRRTAIQSTRPAPAKGIQADRPLEPWQQPCWLRFDVGSHAGEPLLRLGFVSLVLGMAALVCGLPALLGLPLSALTWFLAHLYLERIHRGEINPHSEQLLAEAQDMSRAAFVLCCLAVAMWGLICVGGRL